MQKWKSSQLETKLMRLLASVRTIGTCYRVCLFKIIKYFLLFCLVVTALAFWKFFSTDLSYLTPGIADTRPISVEFNGGNGKHYVADIPRNYFYANKTEALDHMSPIRLWATYPDFNGYFPDGHQKSKSDNWIHFDFTGWNEEFSEEQFLARYGRKGIQALVNAHWQLNHTLSAQQPYGNPIEYVVKWKAEQKDYIFDAGDHAVRIECGKSFSKECSAFKLWDNTHIVIEYRFAKKLLNNFGNIEAGIDKLLHSFNLREIPSDSLLKTKGRFSLYTSCHPYHYAAMINDVDSILESDEGKVWRGDDFITAIVRQYIPINCGMEEVISHLKSVGFKIENKNSQELSTIIMKIPLREDSYFIWLHPSLEIKITHKQARIESVKARIYHPNIIDF